MGGASSRRKTHIMLFGEKFRKIYYVAWGSSLSPSLFSSLSRRKVSKAHDMSTELDRNIKFLDHWHPFKLKYYVHNFLSHCHPVLESGKVPWEKLPTNFKKKKVFLGLCCPLNINNIPTIIFFLNFPTTFSPSSFFPSHKLQSDSLSPGKLLNKCNIKK